MGHGRWELKWVKVLPGGLTCPCSYATSQVNPRNDPSNPVNMGYGDEYDEIKPVTGSVAIADSPSDEHSA